MGQRQGQNETAIFSATTELYLLKDAQDKRILFSISEVLCFYLFY
jgi:hypothetical protein